MNAVGDRCTGVLINNGGVGEIHQHGAAAAVPNRLAHGAETAFEISCYGHLQLAKAQLQTHVCPLFAGGVVDGANQAAVFGSHHSLDHLGAHAPQGTGNNDGNRSGHESAADAPKPMGRLV